MDYTSSVARTRAAGFTTVEMMIVVAVLVLFAGIAVPQLLSARNAAEEGSAMATLRRLMTAQAAYAATGDGRFGELEELMAADLIDESLVASEAQGYDYAVIPRGKRGYSVTATPRRESGSVRRRFFGDETGVIRYTIDGSMPSAHSPSVGSAGIVALIPVMDR